MKLEWQMANLQGCRLLAGGNFIAISSWLVFSERKLLRTVQLLSPCLLCCLMAAPCAAAPIKYELVIPNASVQLGTRLYANVPVTFTFVGDDKNAFSGATPSDVPNRDLKYSAIYQGVASVTIGGPGPVRSPPTSRQTSSSSAWTTTTRESALGSSRVV